MAVTVSFNGTNYTVPSNRDPKGWGASLTSYLVALGTSLSKAGGNFTLTADVNFGANYGIVSVYYKSASANIATSGVFRLANDEGITWRNAANAANLLLKVDGSNDLVFEGNRILDTTDIIDEDNMSSDSATKVPTQQSVKAYADTKAPVSTTVTLGTAQTITGVKTFDEALGMKQISTPSNPSSGYMKIYPKTDGSFYTLDENGNEIKVGSGAGGGKINLNTNPNAEIDTDLGATDDIGDYIDSGAGTTSSKTTTPSEIPLYPFKTTAIAIDLASGTNDYTGLRFQVPEAYRGIALGIGWDQIVSGVSAEDIKVELYSYSDNYSTGETEVPLFFDNSSGDTFVPAATGFLSSSFNPDPSREYYELRWINNGATSGSLFMNEVSFFAQALGHNSIISRLNDYSLTIVNAANITTDVGKGLRVGDSLFLDFQVTGAAGNTASQASVEWPYPNLTPTWSNGEVIDCGKILDSSGSAYVDLVGEWDSSNSRIDLYFQSAVTTSSVFNGTGFSANRVWRAQIFVQITEWIGQGTTLTATEAQLQNARGRFYVSGENVAVSGNAITPFDTVSTKLTNIGVNNSSGTLSVDIAGDYKIRALISRFTGTWTTGGGGKLSIWKNGSLYTHIGADEGQDVLPGSASIYLTPSDVFSIRATAAWATSGGDIGCWVSVERISDRSAQIPGFPFLGDTTTGTGEVGVIVKQDAIADIGGAPSQSDYNNLLQKLRNAGIISA